MARFVWWLGAATLMLAACEPRVEEPPSRLPTTRQLHPSQPTKGPVARGTTAPTTAASSTPKPPRCVQALAKAPQRPLPPQGPAAGCPADPGNAPKLGQGIVKFVEAGVQINVEIARHDNSRARGLMYRKNLADDAGMLFVFERERKLSFWMRNTCIGLDMLFVANDGLIVGIEENVPTLNDNSYQVRCNSRYVVEVNAGWARRNGVRPGQRIALP